MSHSPLQYTSTLTPTGLPPQLGSMPTAHLVQLPPTIQSIPTSTQLHPFQQPDPGVYQPCLLHHHPTHPFGTRLASSTRREEPRRHHSPLHGLGDWKEIYPRRRTPSHCRAWSGKARQGKCYIIHPDNAVIRGIAWQCNAAPPQSFLSRLAADCEKRALLGVFNCLSPMH